jgi:hypothetical protein
MSKGGAERSMMLTLLAFKCQQHYGGGGRDSAGHRAFVGDRVLRSRLVRTCDDSFQSMAILTVPKSVGARTPTTTLDPTLIGKIVTTVTDSGTEPEHRGPLSFAQVLFHAVWNNASDGGESFFLVAAAGPWSPDVFSFFREPCRTLRDFGSATRSGSPGVASPSPQGSQRAEKETLELVAGVSAWPWRSW